MSTESEKELKKIRVLEEIKEFKTRLSEKKRFRNDQIANILGVFIPVFLLLFLQFNESTRLNILGNGYGLLFFVVCMLLEFFFFIRTLKAIADISEINFRIRKKYSVLKRLG